MLSPGNWMKLCRLERFPRHLVISFQFLWSPALWKLLLLGGERTGVRWRLTLNSWSQLFSGLWKTLWLPLWKSNSYKKRCPVFLPLQDCLLFCHLLGTMGKGNKLSKRSFWLSLPEPMCQPAPQPACCAPQQLHRSWELLEHDWLVPPMPSPKCQRGLALLSELAPGNLLGKKGSMLRCKRPRARPEPDPFVIIIGVIVTTTLVIFQHFVVVVSLRKVWARKKICHLS